MTETKNEQKKNNTDSKVENQPRYTTPHRNNAATSTTRKQKYF